MAYVKQTWASGSEGGTLISATRLTHIEDGIFDAAAVADAAVAAAAEVSTALGTTGIGDLVDVDVTTEPPQVGEGVGWAGAEWIPMPFARMNSFVASLDADLVVATEAKVESDLLLGAPTTAGDGLSFDLLTGELTVTQGGWCHFDIEATPSGALFDYSASPQLIVKADGALLVAGQDYNGNVELGQAFLHGFRYVAAGTVLTFHILLSYNATVTTATTVRILKLG